MDLSYLDSCLYISSIWPLVFIILANLPLLFYLLAFVSVLPVTAAMTSEQPFPNITFASFNEFVVKHFNSNVSLATVLLVLFTMTENPDLLNLHARQKHPHCVGEIKQVSSGWIRALARSLESQLKTDIDQLFQETISVNEDDVISPLTKKIDKLMDVLKLNPFSKSGKLKKRIYKVSYDKIAAVHIICPFSMECEDTQCDPRAMQQRLL